MMKDNNDADLVLLNLNISPELKQKFKIKTIENKTTMTDVIIDAIKEYIDR